MACSIAITIDATAGSPVRLRIVSAFGDAADAGRPDVPKLGPRLIAAYASQAEIAVRGTARPSDPLELQLPETRAGAGE